MPTDMKRFTSRRRLAQRRYDKRILLPGAFSLPYAIRPARCIVNCVCRATIRMRCAELTGVGESVKVRQEGKANHHFHREPCGRTREGAFEASAAARAAGMIEQRKRYGPECRGFLIGRRQYRQDRHGEGLPGSALSEESRDARTPLVGTREGFDSPRQSCRGCGRKEII